MKPAYERPELVASALRLRGDTPVLEQGAVVEQAEDRLRVPDVDREQHGAILGAERIVASQERDRA